MPPSRPPRRRPPPPRFAVGELVMIRSAIDPARNTDCTRVLDREWFDGETDRGHYRGWQYVVARHTDAWAMEGSLRPRPQPATLSWQALRARLGGAPVRTAPADAGAVRRVRRRQLSCPSSILSKP